MKQLLSVILAMLVLGAMVPGCDSTHRYDSRLTTADGLMHDHADSALALLEGLPLSDLTTAADTAYYRLLLTQSRYKAYITATSDSDINRALAYYRAHPKEREKLTRAYIYKGTVMEELGHPDSAMHYYKHAETTADSADYDNMGYCNLRIAQLYQRHYANDSAVVSRMKRAYHYFTLTQDTDYMITAIGSQGAYPNIVGNDTSLLYLKKAIELSKKVNSLKGFQYQSKLAGRYYYQGDYRQAKDLAMDIVRNGSDVCNERQFYYYAAWSYIHLHLIDSAHRLIPQIPAPNSAIDSMNYFQMMAQLSQATHHYHDYQRYAEAAKSIDIRLLEKSRNSKLTEAELNWDAAQHEKELSNQAGIKLTMAICLFLLIAVMLIAIGTLAIKVIAHRYQKKLDLTQNNLEQLISDTEKRMQELQSEKEKQMKISDSRSKELEEIRKKNKELESKQSNITKQVSFIIRCRQNALNELYQGIRVKSDTRRARSVIPLVGLIKDLNEKKKLLHTTPKDSFWANIKLAIDGEYEGIASFVEKKYPSLSIKELHLFWLLCAKLPNQIIKICMDYTNDVTVSNNKRRLMKEKIGLDLKFEEFIHLYLEGKLKNNSTN